ncbi:MAG: retron system putative HNH endonuclease [Oscillospiraceae bacterium]
MIPIKKGVEPPELKTLRQKSIEKGLSPEEAYDTLKGNTKEIVRQSLLKEQGHLCAYCMCRIPRNDVCAGIAPIRLEHLVSRNPKDGRDIGQGLDYNNLLAVCNGNTASSDFKRKSIDLTCDVHKGNTDLHKVNPCIPETLESIFYYVDGRIDATDPDVRADLLDTLNLNCPKSPIVSEREAALSALMSNMDEVQEDELINYCKIRLKAFQDEQENKTPYQGILIWYLESLLKTLTSSNA